MSKETTDKKKKNCPSDIIKIILVNISILFLGLFFLEVISFYFSKQEKFIANTSFRLLYDTYIHDNMRPPFGLDFEKKSIILFGCSYAFGDYLDDVQTFSYKLSQFTKRPVFNKAYCSFSASHMFWQVKQPDFFQSINKEPEYAIYLFCGQLHLSRLHHSLFHKDVVNIRYTLDKNNELKEFSTPFDKFSNIYLINFLYNLYFYREANEYSSRFPEKDIQIMKELIIQTYNKLREQYPDIKFIVVYFNDISNHIDETEPLFYEELFKNLPDYGIKFIDTADLIGFKFDHDRDKEWTIKLDGHPNEKVWDLIVPKLSDALNL